MKNLRDEITHLTIQGNIRRNPATHICQVTEEGGASLILHAAWGLAGEMRERLKTTMSHGSRDSRRQIFHVMTMEKIFLN